MLADRLKMQSRVLLSPFPFILRRVYFGFLIYYDVVGASGGDY
jgi:hypothetical protein